MSDCEHGAILSPNVVRRELFKLFYKEDQFNINEKADAAEAYSTIMSLIHASFLPGEKEGRQAIPIDTICSP